MADSKDTKNLKDSSCETGPGSERNDPALVPTDQITSVAEPTSTAETDVSSSTVVKPTAAATKINISVSWIRLRWKRVIAVASVIGTIILFVGELIHSTEGWIDGWRVITDHSKSSPILSTSICAPKGEFKCEGKMGGFIVSNVEWNDPDQLNIRSTPEMSSTNIIGHLPYNTEGIIRNECKDLWCSVTCGNLTGFAGVAFLTYLDDAYREVTGVSDPGSGLPIYTGPNLTCPKTGQFIPFKEQKVVVHMCLPGPIDRSTWCEIDFKGNTGFVEGAYLQPLPKGFVYLRDVAPTIIQDIRYAGRHNFIGRIIKGYDVSECILTEEAAKALADVQMDLADRKLSLIVWDCYRPDRAVRQFIDWVRDPEDITMKAEFYPNFDKTRSIIDGYLVRASAHSRGSAVDAGLISDTVHQVPPPESVGPPLKPCTASRGQRFDDYTIDLGTEFDCFDDKAQFDDQSVTAEAQGNRQLLRGVMVKHGFKGIAKEWWHFELAQEPFPYRQFDFKIPHDPRRQKD